MFTVEVTKNTEVAVHGRVIDANGHEVWAGGVDKPLPADMTPEQALFERAKLRGVGAGSSATAARFEAEEGASEATVTLVSAAPHVHEDLVTLATVDGAVKHLLQEISAVRDAIPRGVEEHEHALPAHGHQALDMRMKALESAVEAAEGHTHPHTHAQVPHEHGEIAKLNEAIIALAEELRETRRAFLGHDHKHDHSEVPEHSHPLVEHDHPHGHPHDHELQEHTHPREHHAHHEYDTLYGEVSARIQRLEQRPRERVEMRVLSRENRGGKDIIIAEEVR